MGFPRLLESPHLERRWLALLYARLIDASDLTHVTHTSRYFRQEVSLMNAAFNRGSSSRLFGHRSGLRPIPVSGRWERVRNDL